MFDNEHLSYVNAIKCLQNLPGKTGHLYPGVRSRYDDYVATHITTTELYHYTVSFFFPSSLFFLSTAVSSLD